MPSSAGSAPDSAGRFQVRYRFLYRWRGGGFAARLKRCSISGGLRIQIHLLRRLHPYVFLHGCFGTRCHTISPSDVAPLFRPRILWTTFSTSPGPEWVSSVLYVLFSSLRNCWRCSGSITPAESAARMLSAPKPRVVRSQRTVRMPTPARACACG